MANQTSLPLVPLDSNDERRHRSQIATAVNQLIKVRPPNDRTEAEVAASVTPSDYAYPECHAWRYGADPTGAADSTTALNNLFHVAKLARKTAYIPGGYYLATQLVVYNGVIVEGDGIGEYGVNGDADNVTLLVQDTGVDDDFIIFSTDLVSSFERLQNGGLRSMVIVGDSGNAAGNGISFRKAGTRSDDANHAILGSIYFLSNLLIRGFPEHGIHLRRGCTGNVVFRDVETYFNGGYGINIEAITLLQNLLLENCGGDGNTGGAAIHVETNNRDACVTIINPWGEYRTNSTYGVTTGFNAAQPYTVSIGDFGSTSNTSGIVNIFGGMCQSSYDTNPGVAREAPDAGVIVDCTANNQMPLVNIVGMQVVDETSPTITSGNGDLLYDVLNSTRVASDVKTTIYRRNGNVAALTGSGHVVIGDTGEYASTLVGDNGVQLRGATPHLSYYETDGPSNEKIWNQVASGGDLTLRLVSDDGSTSTTVYTITRSGTSLGAMTFAITPVFTSFFMGSSSGPKYTSGTGSPEGVVTAAIGSIYSRTDGGAGTSIYVKESGAGNTGWVAK